MIRIVARRLIFGFLTVLGVYALTFLIVIALPGNPLQQGERALSPEVEAALRARYNMDNNWLYFAQFLRGAIRLDFGPTYMYTDWTCNHILARALPVSALLGVLAILLAVGVGVPAGMFSAVRRDGFFDMSVLALVLVGVSLPMFVTGSMLLMLFAVVLPWAPVGGWGTLAHLPLPAITLSLPFMAAITRLTRMSMLDVLSSDFIRTAVAKGASSWTVISRHALRVAFLPVLSYLGPATAQAMTGSFVVEKIFGVPGLGQHFVNAALNRDAGLILATVLCFATLLVLFNLIVDVLYAWLDPRVADAV